MANFDVRTPDKNFNPANFAATCKNGTCTCAPTCPHCGKAKMWDSKKWPGYHDFNCNQCHRYSALEGTLQAPWKAA